MNTARDSIWTSGLSGSAVIFDEWRGGAGATRKYFNKDFAIAYDRLICLKDGEYLCSAHSITNDTGADSHMTWFVNGVTEYEETYIPSDDFSIRSSSMIHLKRGDYIQLNAEFGHENLMYNEANIIRLG